MRILITGAGGNMGRGIIPRLREAGHDLVLSDVNRLPDGDSSAGLPFVQCDLQNGFGLERAVVGCDLVLHLPAWHGIHWGQKTEVDYWRLNVDGTFYMFQAAKDAGVKRVVFLSSTAWYGHYNKYGFTKRIGEELCEYYRENHGMRYVAVRPNDLTPWGKDWVNHYGARLLYGGVDRDDVLDCIAQSIQFLETPLSEGREAENLVVHAVRGDVYTEEQIAGWENDPVGTCEQIFPGSAALVRKYNIGIDRKPSVSKTDDGARVIGYAPSRHFGTFLETLRRLDEEGGAERVTEMHCGY
ncbi:MAG: NAD(P)-dependent oxidoreductase [Akkermansiaceae bacterium]|nr:NAD(P)-dependent oxidoreductase [Armatimonadota bacterium]